MTTSMLDNMEEGDQLEMQSVIEDYDVGQHPARKPTPKQMKMMSRIDSLELESGKVTGMEHHGFPKVFSMRLTLKLAFLTIGVVYGDVGTSPLYVFSSTFPNGISKDHPQKDVLGALCLIIYTLTLIPLLKYVFIVLQANDRGEGGTFALYSLISRHAKVSIIPNEISVEDRKLSGYKLDLTSSKVKHSSRVKQKLESSTLAQKILLLLALVGTCMVIGDGILTPAISVLSAVEGIKVQATSLNQNVVVIISCVILVILFSVQHLGTDRVGFMFAPCVILWFLFIGLIGLYNIFKYDAAVFRAFNPKCIYDYFKVNKKDAWISLGGVVLCITGTEAMFADLGHFSVRSIQIAFTTLVYPCLLSAYIGQAAYLLKHPEHVDQTFYKSIPGAIYWPQFVVAVMAAIIASQAMISATFSIIKQSMALGCFPRVKIVHTSKKHVGQIYIPEINWFLMVACIAITAAFKNTNQIGNAYGICVVTVMIVTTSFLTIIMLMIWQTSIFLALTFFIGFGSLELFYLSSVLEKFKQGGWLPLLFAAIFLLIMITWYYGNATKYKHEVKNAVPTEWITGKQQLAVTRVPGIGLVYTELAQGIPEIFSHFLSNLPAMHSAIIFVNVKHLPVANVLQEERFLFRRVGAKKYHIYRCIARYGYQDNPEKNESFELLLLDWLAHFIRAEALETEQPVDIMNYSTKTQMDHEIISVLPASKVLPFDPTTLVNQQPTSVILECDGVEAEVSYLEMARQDGIVYILGHSDIKASENSSIVKKLMINYAFNFLRRNFRESVISLDIPNKKLLKVGMNYQI